MCVQILHSTGVEFAEEMRVAGDLEQVIEVHARYVRTLHERCLLHKKLAFLRDAVTKVLNLTLAFAMRWDQGIHNIRSGVSRVGVRGQPPATSTQPLLCLAPPTRRPGDFSPRSPLCLESQGFQFDPSPPRQEARGF